MRYPVLWLLCVVALGGFAGASDTVRWGKGAEILRWTFINATEHSGPSFDRIPAGNSTWPAAGVVADLGSARIARHRDWLPPVVPVEFDGEYPIRRPPSDARQWRRAYEQAVLGNAFWHGRGMDRDVEKAVALYRRAARAGSALGMSGLARAHYRGLGAERNLDTAVHWLERAADERLSSAYFALALHHRRGTTGPANPIKAQRYLKQGLDIAIWSASRSSIDREKANPAGAAYMAAGDVFACAEAAPPDRGLALAFWVRAAVEGYPGLWRRMRGLASHALPCAPSCRRC